MGVKEDINFSVGSDSLVNTVCQLQLHHWVMKVDLGQLGQLGHWAALCTLA